MPAPIIILLPGMDGTGRLFKPFVQALAGQFMLTSVRYPGDRNLAYPALLATVQSLLPASEPYVLVAESFSTPIAILCAANSNTNMRGLILCAGFAHSPGPNWFATLTPLLRVAFSLPLPKTISKYLLLGNTASEGLLSEVRLAVASVQPNVLARRLREILTCDVRRELASTTVPLLYIHATKDRLVGMQAFRDIQAIRPDASLAAIEAPHLVLQREPEQSARTVSAFIEGLA